jgi:molecular chaperone DnaJ
MVQEAVCPVCKGEGQVVSDPCPTCGGSGLVQSETTVVVDIPPGVAEGNYITVSGKGDAGRGGGPTGDLIVIIQEKPHDLFLRHGEDLICDIDITFSEAALGSSKNINTLDDKGKLKIPEGTQPETVFKLRGRGLPELRGRNRGDLLIRVHVRTPDKLDKAQKRLFEQLAETGL